MVPSFWIVGVSFPTVQGAVHDERAGGGRKDCVGAVEGCRLDVSRSGEDEGSGESDKAYLFIVVEAGGLALKAILCLLSGDEFEICDVNLRGIASAERKVVRGEVCGDIGLDRKSVV